MATTVEVAAANGIRIPQIAWTCSKRVGIPFWATCAFLEQESSGGMNVFGHDGGWYSGAGLVTKAKYLAYRDGRDEHNAQGVGPMQLTWPPYQDAADSLGGCWVPTHNLTQGLIVLAGFINAGASWHEAARLYNGSEAYADQIDQKIARWKRLLAGATPPGGHMTGWGPPYGRRQWYDATYSDGSPVLVTNRLAQALERARVLLGYTEPLTVTQGCFHDGSLSGGTHEGADVVDLIQYDAENKVRVLCSIGFIPWWRRDNWDGKGSGGHIHAILRGSKELSPAAAAQVPDWDKHLDGLASHSHYPGPWYPVKNFVWHPNYEQEHAPPHKPPPPPKRPLADEWLRTTHAASMAAAEAAKAGAAFKAAHPGMPLFGALADRQAAQAAVARGDAADVRKLTD